MHEMSLIGRVFVTYLMSVGGEIAIVKMQDWIVPGRKNTSAYREYLAFCLASRVGLHVPRTTLHQDLRYGRMSVQRYLDGATKPTRSSLERIATRSLGMRIALFDILCGNHDRKPENLLQLGTSIIPVDFNTAFETTMPRSDFEQETDIIFGRWFQIRGFLSLKPRHLSILLAEARRMAEHLDDPYLDACLEEIPRSFCDESEAQEVRNYLVMRRERLHGAVSTWWDKNVAPLHRFSDHALAAAIREHTR